MSGIKFSPGSVVATPGALEAFRASGEEPLPFLQRHLTGDTGANWTSTTAAKTNSPSNTASGYCRPTA
jgi:hypothetical protein